MSVLTVVATGLQVAGVLAGAPLVIGGMRQVRARLEGRAGGGIGQCQLPHGEIINAPFPRH